MLVHRDRPIDAFEPHPIVRVLGKPFADFTGGDLLRAMEELGLRPVNLRHVGGDGRLKTLAGMAVLARRGLADPGSIELAERLNAADHEDSSTCLKRYIARELYRRLESPPVAA
jgi:hypothetical protein